MLALPVIDRKRAPDDWHGASQACLASLGVSDVLSLPSANTCWGLGGDETTRLPPGASFPQEAGEAGG